MATKGSFANPGYIFLALAFDPCFDYASPAKSRAESASACALRFPIQHKKKLGSAVELSSNDDKRTVSTTLSSNNTTISVKNSVSKSGSNRSITSNRQHTDTKKSAKSDIIDCASATLLKATAPGSALVLDQANRREKSAREKPSRMTTTTKQKSRRAATNNVRFDPHNEWTDISNDDDVDEQRTLKPVHTRKATGIPHKKSHVNLHQAQTQTQAQDEYQAHAHAQAQAQARGHGRGRDHGQAQARTHAQAQGQVQAQANAQSHSQVQIQAQAQAQPTGYSSVPAQAKPHAHEATSLLIPQSTERARKPKRISVSAIQNGMVQEAALFEPSHRPAAISASSKTYAKAIEREARRRPTAIEVEDGSTGKHTLFGDSFKKSERTGTDEVDSRRKSHRVAEEGEIQSKSQQRILDSSDESLNQTPQQDDYTPSATAGRVPDDKFSAGRGGGLSSRLAGAVMRGMKSYTAPKHEPTREHKASPIAGSGGVEVQQDLNEGLHARAGGGGSGYGGGNVNGGGSAAIVDSPSNQMMSDAGIADAFTPVFCDATSLFLPTQTYNTPYSEQQSSQEKPTNLQPPKGKGAFAAIVDLAIGRKHRHKLTGDIHVKQNNRNRRGSDTTGTGTDARTSDDLDSCGGGNPDDKEDAELSMAARQQLRILAQRAKVRAQQQSQQEYKHQHQHQAVEREADASIHHSNSQKVLRRKTSVSRRPQRSGAEQDVLTNVARPIRRHTAHHDIVFDDADAAGNGEPVLLRGWQRDLNNGGGGGGGGGGNGGENFKGEDVNAFTMELRNADQDEVIWIGRDGQQIVGPRAKRYESCNDQQQEQAQTQPQAQAQAQRSPKSHRKHAGDRERRKSMAALNLAQPSQTVSVGEKNELLVPPAQQHGVQDREQHRRSRSREHHRRSHHIDPSNLPLEGNKPSSDKHRTHNHGHHRHTHREPRGSEEAVRVRRRSRSCNPLDLQAAQQQQLHQLQQQQEDAGKGTVRRHHHHHHHHHEEGIEGRKIRSRHNSRADEVQSRVSLDETRRDFDQRASRMVHLTNTAEDTRPSFESAHRSVSAGSGGGVGINGNAETSKRRGKFVDPHEESRLGLALDMARSRMEQELSEVQAECKRMTMAYDLQHNRTGALVDADNTGFASPSNTNAAAKSTIGKSSLELVRKTRKSVARQLGLRSQFKTAPADASVPATTLQTSKRMLEGDMDSGNGVLLDAPPSSELQDASLSPGRERAYLDEAYEQAVQHEERRREELRRTVLSNQNHAINITGPW